MTPFRRALRRLLERPAQRAAASAWVRALWPGSCARMATALLFSLSICSFSSAGEVAAVSVKGSLIPSVPSVVWLSFVDDDGVPAAIRPRVTASNALVRSRVEPTPSGVWAFTVIPEPGVKRLRLEIGVGDERHTVELPVVDPQRDALVVPRRIVGSASAGRVSFLVRGDNLPGADGLQVVTGEGEVESVTEVDEGLEVVLRTEVSPYPRFVSVGVRDRRGRGLPVWTGLRLKAQPQIPIQTEPGAVVNITVTDRKYGPYVADERGAVVAIIDQYPEEMSARVNIVDPFGNETDANFALSGQYSSSLVPFVIGEWAPGTPAPMVVIRAVHGDGAPWRGDPACETPRSGLLKTVALGAGEWRVLTPDFTDLQVRIRCSVGSAENGFTLVQSPEVPAAIRLRVFPNQLSTDFPVADVRAVLENVGGEPLSPDGVVLSADVGEVTPLDTQALAVLAEYQGADAVEAGEDRVRATLIHTATTGVTTGLEIGFGRVPSGEGGLLRVFARPLGANGRPIFNQIVALAISDGEPVVKRSGPDGWAVAELPVEAGRAPIRITASTEHQSAHGLAVRGSDGFRGPGTPDLAAEHRVTMAQGRAANMTISTSPSLLFNTARAVAMITVDLRDRAGEPVSGERLELEVSEGRVSSVEEQQDGVYVWEYYPPPGVRPRTIQMTASSSSLAQSASTELEVMPAPVERALGVSVGGLTNFGAILSPSVSVDNDVRLRVGRTSLMIRAGIAWYQDATTVETGGLGENADLRMFLVPVTAGAMLRHDIRNHGLWFGVGLIVAPYRGEIRFGDDLSDVAWGVLPPGVVIIGGYGLRVPGGELTLELRGSTLFSPGTNFPYRGPVGGLAALLGYRIVY